MKATVASSGVFNTPVGADMPGPALPGGRYSFEFSASPGQSLSFATMFVQSNDLFFAPMDTGIPLFSGDGGAPLTGIMGVTQPPPRPRWASALAKKTKRHLTRKNTRLISAYPQVYTIARSARGSPRQVYRVGTRSAISRTRS